MKKYILVVVLVLILVSIAYIKAIYSTQERQKVQDISQNDEYIGEADLEKMADSLRLFFVDSVYAALSDSISVLSDTSDSNEKIAKLNQTIDSLENSYKSLDAKFDRTNSELKNAKDDYSGLRLNLADKYYKGELANLPADLSDYEKSVSIKEIKNKTKKYFDLTTEQLNGIAKKNK
ncbi:MAG: hypothetical protein ABIE07_12950 [Candidatus Zixiibacteriota bacterium]